MWTTVELRQVVCRGIDGVRLSLLGSGVGSQLGFGAESQQCGRWCRVTAVEVGCSWVTIVGFGVEPQQLRACGLSPK